MDAGLKEAFCNVKPYCDVVMVNPTNENVSLFQEALTSLDKKVIQDMQLYILYPVITHLKSPSIKNKQDIQYKFVNIMKHVMKHSSVKSLEIFTKFHNCLLSIVFDKAQPGMVAVGSEELKFSVMECLTVMMLNMEGKTRLTLFQTLVPMLAQTVFVAVHIAKLEKLRKLRIMALACVQAYTGTHSDLSSQLDVHLENAAVDLIGSILPGVSGALLEVINDGDNPGHAVVVSAIQCLRNLLCLVMNNKHLQTSADISIEDFAAIMQVKAKSETNCAKSPKDVAKKTPEWFKLAADKLQLVTNSAASVHTHPHPAVRKEVAVFCAGILLRCSRTMQPSIPKALDVLISLSKDEYPDISGYCATKLERYLRTMPPDIRYHTLDGLADNFMAALGSLPRVLNNIDCSRKLSTLNLLHGYIELMSRSSQLSNLLEVPRTVSTLCDALIEAVRMQYDAKLLALTSVRQIEPPPRLASLPWCTLRHIDDSYCVQRLQDICRLLGHNARTIVDRLLDVLVESHADRNEVLYLLNSIASASSDEALIKLVLDTYLDPELWYLPTEIISHEPAHSVDLVYNPSAWDKDSVPGLYEGAIETRYTDISYQSPRASASGSDVTLSTAISNMAARCLLTHGVGKMAAALGDKYQPYLMKTLCLVLERIGSEYEMLHVSGIIAIHDIAAACARADVLALIRTNADYFTYQVTTRLKKSWNSESALEMLSVVMLYSDSTMFDCFYGIVTDVLLQSCDKYHEQDLTAYLKVFVTFLTSIQQWYPNQPLTPEVQENNLFKDTIDYINANKFDGNTDVVDEETDDNNNDNFEGMEEHENIENEQDPPPPPLHIQMTEKILKRCLNFVPSKRMSERLLALDIMDRGIRVLETWDKLVFPMVHQIWSPLEQRFQDTAYVVRIKAIGLLQTMADVTKDFIAKRTVKQVLPALLRFLSDALPSSHLKDKGSAYRLSQEYRLQIAILTALPTLVTDLGLDDTPLEQCLECCGPYLSNRQPKPLQELAVNFFRTCITHDYGQVWHHLRLLCHNQFTLCPPRGTDVTPCVGTPYEASDPTYDANVKLIFKAVSYQE